MSLIKLIIHNIYEVTGFHTSIDVKTVSGKFKLSASSNFQVIEFGFPFWYYTPYKKGFLKGICTIYLCLCPSAVKMFFSTT